PEFQFASIHAIGMSYRDATTPPEKLNLCGECKRTIYAIYFHFSRVGRGSDQKNQKRFCKSLSTINFQLSTHRQPVAKLADLQGNLKIFEFGKWRAVRWCLSG